MLAAVRAVQTFRRAKQLRSCSSTSLLTVSEATVATSNSIGISVGFLTYLVSYAQHGEPFGSVVGGLAGVTAGSMPLFWATRSMHVPCYALGMIAGSYFYETYIR